MLLASPLGELSTLDLSTTWEVTTGVIAGVLIGIVATVMGVAGGELLIPTIVVLYGVEIKLAGSLSLAVSLPTMLVAFARYSRDRSFGVLREHARFVVVMALGSVVGAVIGGLLLGAVPDFVIVRPRGAADAVGGQGLAARVGPRVGQ